MTRTILFMEERERDRLVTDGRVEISQAALLVNTMRLVLGVHQGKALLTFGLKNVKINNNFKIKPEKDVIQIRLLLKPKT